MLTVSRLYLRYDRQPADEGELEELADLLYEEANRSSREFLELQELGVVVRVREGSLEIVTIIITYATSLFLAIGSYGDFREGLRVMKDDARQAGIWIRKRFEDLKPTSKETEKTLVTTGHVTQLLQITKKVEDGALSPPEAHEATLEMLHRAGEEVPEELSDQLYKLLRGIRVERTKRPAKRPRKRPKRSRPSRKYHRGVEIRREPGGKEKKRRILGEPREKERVKVRVKVGKSACRFWKPRDAMRLRSAHREALS